LFFAMERSRPWQLPADDAGQLLLDFAQAPGYLETVQASMVDVPTRLERITCPVLLLQGTADPLVSLQSPRFLAFVRHVQLQWLPGLSHVPISDDPRLVASIMCGPQDVDREQRTRPKAASTAAIPGQLADHDAGPRQSRHTTVTSSAKSPAR
jgi:hypothetical protein